MVTAASVWQWLHARPTVTKDPEIADFTPIVARLTTLVFLMSTEDMRKCRHPISLPVCLTHMAAGRIIGDYRRVALYGVDALSLIRQIRKTAPATIMDEKIHLYREELSEQIRALAELK